MAKTMSAASLEKKLNQLTIKHNNLVEKSNEFKVKAKETIQALKQDNRDLKANIKAMVVAHKVALKEELEQSYKAGFSDGIDQADALMQEFIGALDKAGDQFERAYARGDYNVKTIKSVSKKKAAAKKKPATKRAPKASTQTQPVGLTLDQPTEAAEAAQLGSLANDAVTDSPNQDTKTEQQLSLDYQVVELLNEAERAFKEQSEPAMEPQEKELTD